MLSVARTPPIVVTGASGFVGACLCRRFAASGKAVLAVCSPSSKPWRLGEAAGIDVARVNLESADDVRALVRDVRPEVVINCAVHGAYPHQRGTDRIYRVNFDAVRTMLEALVEAGRLRAFVQASSSSEYGSNSAAPREDQATHPDSDYAVSKVAATAFVQHLGEKRRVPAWVLRLYSVYGPFEESSRLIPKLLAHAMDGRLPKLVDRHISRDFVFIDDVCDAFERVIERVESLAPGDVFNVGTGRRTTIEEIVTLVRERHGIREEPEWGTMADRAWDRRDWYADARKAEAVLGWRARTSLADGLARTVAWMKANPDLVRAAEENSVAPGP
jgi:dolichol-phosphate mannosyltransferase